MIVSLVAALGKGGEIGINGRMPWHIGGDLKNFKKITMGHCMVMGRKTFESIGRILPGRTTIVLTRNPAFSSSGARTVGRTDEALDVARKMGERELFVVGGGDIYRLFLPLATKMYLSWVDYSGPADTYFPPFDESRWNLDGATSYEAVDGAPAWRFEILTARS